MATLPVSFNGWNLQTNAGVHIGSYSLSHEKQARGQKSVGPDRGATPEITFGVTKIRLSGTIHGDPATGNADADVRDKFGLLMKNLRGVDRIQKGKLSVHGDSTHYFCQLTGSPTFQLIKGEGVASVVLEFTLDDPFRRSDSVFSEGRVVTSSNPIELITFGSDFDGDAMRIPLILNLGGGWQKGELLRVFNSTTGVRFEHVCSQNLGASQEIVIDGEEYLVTENGQKVGEGNAGQFPYLRGGITNSFDFSGSDRFGTFIFEFIDRFMG